MKTELTKRMEQAIIHDADPLLNDEGRPTLVFMTIGLNKEKD